MGYTPSAAPSTRRPSLRLSGPPTPRTAPSSAASRRRSRENYKSWLAREAPPTEWPLELIGANMGFRRSVLEKVPAFDSDLAPGGLGLGEDALFSWQLREAGFTIQFVKQAIVVHSLSASRLRRSAWLKAAEAHGRTNAYLCYHWKHED